MGIKYETQLQVVLLACQFINKNAAFKKKRQKQFAQPMFGLKALLEACEILHKDLWLFKAQTGKQSSEYPGFEYLTEHLEHEKMKVPFKDFIILYNSALMWVYHKKKHDYATAENESKKAALAAKIAKLL